LSRCGAFRTRGDLARCINRLVHYGFGAATRSQTLGVYIVHRQCPSSPAELRVRVLGCVSSGPHRQQSSGNVGTSLPRTLIFHPDSPLYPSGPNPRSCPNRSFNQLQHCSIYGPQYFQFSIDSLEMAIFSEILSVPVWVYAITPVFALLVLLKVSFGLTQQCCRNSLYLYRYSTRLPFTH
jgi:hypothetical protein